ARTSEFQVFRGAVEKGGRAMGLVVPAKHELSRKDITALEESAKANGAKGLAWWKASASGGAGPLARFCAGERGAALMQRMPAAEGDLCLFVADRQSVVWRVLGDLRNQLGKRFALASPDERRFLWVTEFPMFEFDDAEKRWFSAHHPFTAPVDWSLGGGSAD